MTDIWSKRKRSEVMSRIRSRGNKATELRLMSIFRQYGIKGWRRNQKIFGKPDFIFRQKRLAVFVDGCFWHGCPQHAKMPKSNKTFWSCKITANKNRDRQVMRNLRIAGWRVLRIWQHSLKAGDEGRLIRRILAALN